MRILWMIMILWSLTLVMSGCEGKVEAEINDYDELVVVVQELQEMISKVIEAETIQNSNLVGLVSINASILKRITELDKSIRPAISFVGIMLSNDIEVNGQTQIDMTTDKRLALIQKTFALVAGQEKEYDPNLLWSHYEIGGFCIDGIKDLN